MKTPIRLISRAEALQQPLLRAQVAGLQRAMLDADLTPAEVVARGFEPEWAATPAVAVRELVLYHPEASLPTAPGQLGAALRLVLRELGAASWRCLPCLAGPLLGNPRHPYRPVQLAIRQLRRWGAAPQYRGAYQIPLAATADVVRVLFRISRYDGSASEYIFLAPDTDNFVASLCQYGYLHVLSRAEQLTPLRAAFQRAGLQEWEGPEYERFAASGANRGRRIRLH